MAIRDLAPWNWARRNVPVRRGEEEEPVHALQSRMNQLFEDFWRDFGLWHRPGTQALGAFSPHVDVSETDDEVRVRAELPGMSEQDVDVTVANGVLTIQGEKRTESTEEREGVQYSECSYGSFHRDIPLSGDLQEDKAQASFKDGVLTVTLPRSPEAKARTRRIEVQHG